MRVGEMQTWPALRYFAAAKNLRRRRYVGVLEHDGRRMAAQLHGGALHVQARQCGELLAHDGRAGEGDLADHRMRNEIFRNLRRHAVDEVDHAVRHARIGERLDQLRRRRRRFLGRLDDDRAAGRKPRGKLSHDLVDREIPRREGRDRADRLLDRDLVDAGAARRDHPAIGALGFLGEPLDDVGGGHGFHLGFGQRLALLHGHERRDLVIALAHDRGRLAHDPAALERRHRAPDLEPLGGCFQRLVEIGAVGMGHGADGFLGRRVEHGDGPARLARPPFAIDEQLRIGICHETCSLFYCRRMAKWAG